MFPSVISPEIGEQTSLAALVDSTTPALPSFSTDEPQSGNSTKTISPSTSISCCVIPIVPTSPSTLLHSCSFAYLASLGWSPKEPKNVKIGGIVEPSTKLKWDISKDKNIIGYKIYWRKTTSPFWENSRLVGKVNNYKLNGIVIDNYLFGVSSISEKGYESVVVFPNDIF